MATYGLTAVGLVAAPTLFGQSPMLAGLEQAIWRKT